jgi:hypothetical protein
MYMRGMGRYPKAVRRFRTGMGQTPDVTSTTTLNYPGMPGGDQTNQMIATPLSAQQLATLSMQNAQYFGSQQGLGPFAGSPQGTANPSIAWINQNAMTVLGGTIAFLILWKALSK